MPALAVSFEYEIDDVVCEGAVISADDTSGPRPAVLVFHGWEGRSEAQEAIAGRVADLGYVAVACDLFGNGRRGDIGGDNTALIAPLMEDRSALRRRVTGSLRGRPGVAERRRRAHRGHRLLIRWPVRPRSRSERGADPHRRELPWGPHTPARPSDPHDRQQRRRVPRLGRSDGSPADVVALGAELTEAGADWQIHAYGHTMHAFMAEGVDQPERGLRYDERSAGRAWNSLVRLLDETLGT